MGMSLGVGLGHLGLGVGPRDDAAPGIQRDLRRVAGVEGAAAQGDAPRAVTARVHPADRPGIATAVHVLEARRSGSTARAVGVPPTAADGCSEAASVSAEASSALTAATSVARCMTLGRCSTKGASGTFIDEQCGARASATERTAYSCSSRSFDERAREAASARSLASSPVRRIVPASTREVMSPWSRRTSRLGRRADETGHGEDPRVLVALGEATQQPARVDGAGRRRDEVAGEDDLVDLTRPDALHGVGDRMGVVGGGHLAVGERDVTRGLGIACDRGLLEQREPVGRGRPS